MPALQVNITIVHLRGVVARGKTTSQGWTIMMFTLSAGINCFIILKLYFFCIILISFDKLCEHFCKWTARMVPLGTPVVATLYILTSRTRFRSWSFYRYSKTLNKTELNTFWLFSFAIFRHWAYLCWCTISPRGYHPPSSQCFVTDIVYYTRYIYYIYMLEIYKLQIYKLKNVIIIKTKIILPEA
jgi:hypothetical protein